MTLDYSFVRSTVGLAKGCRLLRKWKLELSKGYAFFFFVARLWIIVMNCTCLFGRPRGAFANTCEYICENFEESVQRVSSPFCETDDVAPMASLGDMMSRRLRQMMINSRSMYSKCIIELCSNRGEKTICICIYNYYYNLLKQEKHYVIIMCKCVLEKTWERENEEWESKSEIR